MGAQIDWSALLDRAWEARNNAYAPYSKFAVGAAVLTESGDIFPGCNVENVSFGLTICAERVAAVAAVARGFRDFIGIAIVAETLEPVVPCGACRQFLAEFHPAMPICCVGRDGSQSIFTLSELLPSVFSRFEVD